MSGGSFDYLFCKDAHRLVDAESDVQRMAVQLFEMGFKDASKKTRRILGLIRSIERIQDEMADVWQAVEWFCSSDWGPDQVEEAIDKWRDSLLASTPESPEEPPA